MTKEDYPPTDIEIWAENKPVFDLFKRLDTQWRSGMGGATGLDYTAVLSVMRETGVSGDAAIAMLDDIRIMESQALSSMRE